MIAFGRFEWSEPIALMVAYRIVSAHATARAVGVKSRLKGATALAPQITLGLGRTRRVMRRR